MSEKYIILGLNSFNSHQKISNANWTNQLIEPITINQGDSISVRNCLLDTRTNTTNNILISKDIEISLEFYFYYINRGGNQQPSPFDLSFNIPGQPYVPPLKQVGLFDFLNCLNYGTSDSTGFIAPQVIAPNEIGITSFSRASNVATATLIGTNQIIPLASSGTVAQTSLKQPQPAVSFDADDVSILSTSYSGGATSFTYDDPGPDESFSDSGNIVGYLYSNNKLLATPSCPNLGTQVPLVESIMYPDFTDGFVSGNPTIIQAGIPGYYNPPAPNIWQVGQSVQIGVSIPIYPDVNEVTSENWAVSWNPFNALITVSPNENPNVNMTIGSSYIFFIDNTVNPYILEINVEGKFVASWTGQISNPPLITAVVTAGNYTYLSVLSANENFVFGANPNFTSITFTQTFLPPIMLVTAAETQGDLRIFSFVTILAFDPNALSSNFYFTKIRPDISALCNLNNFCIPMNVTSGDGLPYLAYMNQSELDASGNPTGKCDPTKRVPIKKKWYMTLKAGSYTQNELATIITRSMATQKQKIQRNYWLNNQLSIGTTPTDGINKQYRGIPTSEPIPFDPNVPIPGTQPVPVPPPFYENFNAYPNGALSQEYPVGAYNPSRYYLSKNPKAYPPPDNDLKALSPNYNTEIDKDDQPFLFRPTTYAKPNPFFVPQKGGGIANGITQDQLGSPNAMTSTTSYTGLFTATGTNFPNYPYFQQIGPIITNFAILNGFNENNIPDRNIHIGQNFVFWFQQDPFGYHGSDLQNWAIVLKYGTSVVTSITQFAKLPTVIGGNESQGYTVIVFTGTEEFTPYTYSPSGNWQEYNVNFVWLGDSQLFQVEPPNWQVTYTGVGATDPIVQNNVQDMLTINYNMTWTANSNIPDTTNLPCTFYIPETALLPNQQPNYLYSSGMCYNDANLYKWNEMQQSNRPLVDVYFSPFLTDCFSPYFQNEIIKNNVNTGNLPGPSNFYGIRPTITQQLEYIIYNQVSLVPTGENESINVTVTPTLQYSPNYEAVCPLTGASQMSLIYNPDDNLFQLNYMHTPLYVKPIAGTNTIQESVGIYPSYYYPYPQDQAGLKTPPQGVFQADKQSGIILSSMEPRSFWEQLGFDVDACIANPPDNERGASFMTFEEFLKKTTGGFSGSANNYNDQIDMVGSSEQCYASMVDIYSVGGSINLPPTNGQQITSTVFQNTYDISPIFYEVTTTNALSAQEINLQPTDCGHYILEITGYSSDFFNDKDNYEVKGIINNYFVSANSFVTTNGQDAFVYYHQGSTQLISNLKIRILNPITMQEQTLLGPNNSIYLQIGKQILQPNIEQTGSNINSQVPPVEFNPEPEPEKKENKK